MPHAERAKEPKGKAIGSKELPDGSVRVTVVLGEKVKNTVDAIVSSTGASRKYVFEQLAVDGAFFRKRASELNTIIKLKTPTEECPVDLMPIPSRAKHSQERPDKPVKVTVVLGKQVLTLIDEFVAKTGASRENVFGQLVTDGTFFRRQAAKPGHTILIRTLVEDSFIELAPIRSTRRIPLGTDRAHGKTAITRA